MARKPSAPQEPQQQIRTFGCRVDPRIVIQQLGRNAQVFYWQWAFAHPATAVDNGAPPRHEIFWLLANALFPNYFIRDPWAERIVNAICYNNWVGIAGCAGCVSGDTRILNPITGERPTIEWLHENRVAPIVMTLNGPRRASEPFIKGVSDLYEVVLANGSRFTCTADHLVLTQDAFVHVGELQIGQPLASYAPDHRVSNLGLFQKAHALDALDSLKIAGDYPGHYSSDSRLCDEQLRCEEESFQSFAPSHNGVPKYNRIRSREGDPACRFSHIPSSSFSHLSNSGFLIRHNSLGKIVEHLPDLEIVEHDDRSCRQSLQFLSRNNFQPRASEQAPDASRTRYSFFDRNSTGELDPYVFQVVQSNIVSIRATGKAIYYDLSVPGPEHYFAEGAIHHNSAKTHVVTGFAALWWLCDPKNSSVMFCSTTSKSLRKRNWANVQSLHSLIPGEPFGNFVDSRMQWQSKRGDDKFAMSGIAVEEGDPKESADRIKGTHTKRQMVIINEANSVNAGIWKAVYNLYEYPESVGGEFILIAEANPASWHDEFGKFTTPEKGLTSVTVDTEEWTTVKQLNGKNGICIRFDIEKTPNLDYPSDKPINRHLPSREQAERCMRAPDRDSAEYWSNKRGFPPPEGLSKNVFSEVALEMVGAYDRHRFTGNNFQIIGAFDPARTGDKPTVRFAAMGELDTGEMGIELMKPIELSGDVKVASEKKITIDYQLRDQLKRECENVWYRGSKTVCPFANLGIDGTGGGADFCDIFQQTVSWDIKRVVFSEAASAEAVSHEDMRPAYERYRNKRAEIYFRTKQGFDSGQIKGLDRDTGQEMGTITFDDSGKYLTIVSKEDYREKYKKSPDKTDTVVIVTEVARRKGFKLAVRGNTVKQVEKVSKEFEKSQSVYEEVSYSSDNEEVGMEISYAYEDEA